MSSSTCLICRNQTKQKKGSFERVGSILCFVCDSCSDKKDKKNPITRTEDLVALKIIRKEEINFS